MGEPSAVEGFNTFFRMAPALGVDEDTGARICHGKWAFEAKDSLGIMPEGSYVKNTGDYRKGVIYLTDPDTKVLAQDGEVPTFTVHNFGKGLGIYLASFEKTIENTRMLLNLIRLAGREEDDKYLTDNVYTECAYYPASGQLVVINNSDTEQKTGVMTDEGRVEVTLEPYATVMVKLGKD